MCGMSGATGAERIARGRGLTRPVRPAAQANRAEVELGRVATERGASDSVKQFGQRMVTDHGKANDELAKVAQDKGVELPADMDAKHKRLQDRLAKLSGADFDKAYMDAMVKDHDKDVAAFEKEAKSAKDKDLKNFASKTLPTLKSHQKMAHSGMGHKTM